MNGTTAVKQVNVIGNGICYIRSDDMVGCAGNTSVTTGIPTTAAKKLFTSPDDNACIIKMDDTVECWGNNSTNENNVPGNL
jgi:hypothetical protein